MAPTKDALERHWQDLLVRSQDGDTHAYEILLRDMGEALSRWLRRRVADPEERDDVVQEVLLGIHLARHTYRPELSLVTWVNAIARYKVIDYYRKRSRRKARELSVELEAFETMVVVSDEGSPEAAAPGAEGFDDAFAEAFAKLPEKQRRAIELLKLEDLGVKQAAVRMNVSESSLKVLAHRGYEALRAALGVEKKK